MEIVGVSPTILGNTPYIDISYYTWNPNGDPSPLFGPKFGLEAWRVFLGPFKGIEVGSFGEPRGYLHYMGVSKNRGTPKWMVYDGKPY